ncbi:signal peptidase I [Phytoactinopolyspora halotolerans]|uniref:Signal peptidase I n=1 Tax=Phytoactinopolyspora halotolerans TaxID=1981512 RepID=A0A6L9SG88_9ACTN|nr:signal peptidase I [Phytoactinopolyspora halotolerans]NEE03658.1 signal peptidase I [Phytoactinopolyspora halotolerans]
MIEDGVPPGDQEDAEDPKPARRRWVALVKETAIVVALSLIIATVVRIFLVQAFLIPSESMQDTLLVGDRVMVSKISMHFGDVERGDVVVFEDPDNWLRRQPESDGGVGDSIKGFFEFVGVLPDDSEGHLIKRVIGIGGDTVECCDDDGRITINGVAIDESHYLYPGDEPAQEDFSVTVPEGELFVLGDHRSNSGDSRFNGSFSEDLVVGKAFAVVWPISRWSGVGAGDTFDDVPAPE